MINETVDHAAKVKEHYEKSTHHQNEAEKHYMAANKATGAAKAAHAKKADAHALLANYHAVQHDKHAAHAGIEDRLVEETMNEAQIKHSDFDKWHAAAKAKGHKVRKVTTSNYNTYYQAHSKEGGVVGHFNTGVGKKGKGPAGGPHGGGLNESFVDLAQAKNATGFSDKIAEVLQSKIAEALTEAKKKVAKKKRGSGNKQGYYKNGQKRGVYFKD